MHRLRLGLWLLALAVGATPALASELPDLEDPKAQYELGMSRLTGEQKDPAEAVAWLRKAALGGHADAQAQLGVCYQQGYGIDKDLGQALVCKTMRPVLNSLAVENITITRQDELGFILDRSIKQAVATQAPVTFILSPLLTGGKLFEG